MAKQRMGNAPKCGGDAENTAKNHKAVMSSAQSMKTSSDMCTDYSIPGKKRGSYKQDAD